MKKIFNKKSLFIISIIIILLIIGYFITILFPYLGSEIGVKQTSILPNNNERKEKPDLNFEFTEEIGKENQDYSKNFNLTDLGLKLIKKGSVEIDVEKGKFYDSINRIMLLANQFNGTLINSQIYKENENKSGYLIFMVPSKEFDSFITKLIDFGEIKKVNTTTTDVSKEYYDISGRLKILESQRELLLSWLKEAKEIKDMLSIRSELERIETEIETVKGRINYIDYHSNYSEVSIYIKEKHEEIPWWNRIQFFNRLISGLSSALNSILISVLSLIIFLAFILPWAILIYFIYKFIIKYLKRKQNY